MQRMKDDRGAVAVVVALLMIPLIGFGAIAIDLAAIHADRQQLQLGADAAALAIAQDCAEGTCPASPNVVAQSLSDENKNDGDTKAPVVTIDNPGGTVTVKTAGVRQHWLAPVLGFDESDVAARAIASWGVPGGADTLPLIFSVCEIDKLVTAAGGGSYSVDPDTGEYKFENTSDMVTIYLNHPSHSGDPAKDSTCSPEGMDSSFTMPGGFSWITDGSGSCSVYTDLDKPVSNSPGNPGPSTCTAGYLESLVGKTVILPVFNFAEGGGSTGTYSVYGYVGFRISALWLKISGGGGDAKEAENASELADCSNGNGQCIVGRFTEIADLTGPPTSDPDAAELGAKSVHLRE